MQQPELKISKTGAARRQLVTAVRLYFHQADAPSIHTLMAAAYQLLQDLNARRGGTPMMVKEFLASTIKPELQGEFRRRINEAENFLKHADRDPDALLTFRPSQTELLLYDACEKYRGLTGEFVPELDAYKIWSALTWARELVTFDALDPRERLGEDFPTTSRFAFFMEFMSVATRIHDMTDG